MASRKPEAFKDLMIPVSIFDSRPLGVLESLVLHLHKEGMRNCEIAKLLDRDDRTIFTVLKRAQQKTKE